MKKKENIKSYIQTFDSEIDNIIDWLNLHINLMFLEVNQIEDTIHILKIVENEWNRRVENEEKINYSVIRTTLYEALPYRVVLGLSKIFVGTKEFSLLKSVNIISQLENFKDSKEVKDVIQKIRIYLEEARTVSTVTTFRDQLFGHLDKVCVLSEGRIDPAIIMSWIDEKEVEDIKCLINELYQVCFGEELTYKSQELSKQDVIYTFFGDRKVRYRGGFLWIISYYTVNIPLPATSRRPLISW